MSYIDKDAIKTLVKDEFNRQVDAKVMKVEQDIMGQDEQDDGDESVTESEENDSSQLINETLQIEARGPGSKKVDEFTVANIKELNKIAKTGRYDWIMATKKNGDSVEYSVERGKLVEL